MDGGRLELARALPCGLIVNELLTNALKHGYPDGRKGEIRVSLHSSDGHYLLQVEDDGVGLPPTVTVSKTASLGLKLVSVLARQLQGELRSDGESGTRIGLRFPLDGRHPGR